MGLKNVLSHVLSLLCIAVMLSIAVPSVSTSVFASGTSTPSPDVGKNLSSAEPDKGTPEPDVDKYEHDYDFVSQYTYRSLNDGKLYTQLAHIVIDGEGLAECFSVVGKCRVLNADGTYTVYFFQKPYIFSPFTFTGYYYRSNFLLYNAAYDYNGLEYLLSNSYLHGVFENKRVLQDSWALKSSVANSDPYVYMMQSEDWRKIGANFDFSVPEDAYNSEDFSFIPYGDYYEIKDLGDFGIGKYGDAQKAFSEFLSSIYESKLALYKERGYLNDPKEKPSPFPDASHGGGGLGHGDSGKSETITLDNFYLTGVNYYISPLSHNVSFVSWSGVRKQDELLGVPDSDTLVVAVIAYKDSSGAYINETIGTASLSKKKIYFNYEKILDTVLDNDYSWDGCIYMMPTFSKNGNLYMGSYSVVNCFNGDIYEDHITDDGSGNGFVDRNTVHDGQEGDVPSGGGSSGKSDSNFSFDVGNLFSSIENFMSVFSSLFDLVSDFPRLLSTLFSFLPSWVFVLVGSSIGLVLILRFLGR